MSPGILTSSFSWLIAEYSESRSPWTRFSVLQGLQFVSLYRARDILLGEDIPIGAGLSRGLSAGQEEVHKLFPESEMIVVYLLTNNARSAIFVATVGSVWDGFPIYQRLNSNENSIAPKFSAKESLSYRLH